MNRKRGYMRPLLMLAALLLAFACSKEEDVLPEQQKRMESYLTSTHTPRLVAEADVEEGTEQPYYTPLGNTVYRYIEGAYNPDREGRPEVTETSTVTIVFRAYEFSFTNIVTDGSRITLPYFTNDPDLEALFYGEEVGLTPGVWSFEPLVLNLRTNNILKGLRHALVGCRERDRVEAYMTYNMAYGDDYFSILGKEAPVAIFFTVQRVE